MAVGGVGAAAWRDPIGGEIHTVKPAGVVQHATATELQTDKNQNSTLGISQQRIDSLGESIHMSDEVRYE